MMEDRKLRTYGYVRVSTKEQNENRQIDAMEAYGLNEQDLFIDRQSGCDFDRPAYKQMLRKLRPGDQLVIKSIDRLGRNYEEILQQWRLLTKEREVSIVVLDMPVLNSGQTRDLTGTLISDIVLQLLSYVAQTEREFIHQRQAEGIAAAKARGVHFGRKKLELPEEFETLYTLWCSGKISTRKAGAALGVSYQTFLRHARER